MSPTIRNGAIQLLYTMHSQGMLRGKLLVQDYCRREPGDYEKSDLPPTTYTELQVEPDEAWWAEVEPILRCASGVMQEAVKLEGAKPGD